MLREEEEFRFEIYVAIHEFPEHDQVVSLNDFYVREDGAGQILILFHQGPLCRYRRQVWIIQFPGRLIAAINNQFAQVQPEVFLLLFWRVEQKYPELIEYDPILCDP